MSDGSKSKDSSQIIQSFEIFFPTTKHLKLFILSFFLLQDSGELFKCELFLYFLTTLLYMKVTSPWNKLHKLKGVFFFKEEKKKELNALYGAHCLEAQGNIEVKMSTVVIF